MRIEKWRLFVVGGMFNWAGILMHVFDKPDYKLIEVLGIGFIALSFCIEDK